MNYDIKQITHIEFDQTLVFEPKIKLFINDTIQDIINLKGHVDPYNTYSQVVSSWLKLKQGYK